MFAKSLLFLLACGLMVTLRFLEIGRDYVLGLDRNEDRVEFIHLYRLVKP